MKKILKLIGNIVLFLLILILILNIVIIIKSKVNKDKVPGILGYKPLVVLSGSMQSSINIGDLIIVKDTNIKDISKNDVIAFRSGKNVIAHRVINIKNNDGKTYLETKGDNNNVKDENLVKEKDIVGKYKFKIAKLGNFIIFIQKPLGFAILIISILFIGTLIYIFENNKINKELLAEKERSIKELQNKR